MTRQTVVRLICDMPHETDQDGQTYTLMTPETIVEVELCDACAAQYVRLLVQVGRRVRAASATNRPTRVRVRT